MFQKILPDVQRTPAKDRKIVMAGLAVLLTQSQYMLTEGVSAWYVKVVLQDFCL
jgi:hypothetical protein